MTAYYNEIDPFAAAWLRELIKDGLIATGDVDERSIHDVRPEDLAGYTQCHFFAGIGGWSYALRLAGWPDSRPVWTGSCPCQPFSSAGKQSGTKDDRHLWPEFFRLIRESRPDTVFGEQVAAAIGLDWLDHVSDDLEGVGYAVGSIVLPACSVGAPHIRQRLWFVADQLGERLKKWPEPHSTSVKSGQQAPRRSDASGCRGVGELADAVPTGRAERWPVTRDGQATGGSESGELADPGSQRRQQDPGGSPCDESENGRQPERDHEFAGNGENGVALGDTQKPGLAQQRGERGTPRETQTADAREAAERASAPTRGFWRDADWIACRDGKSRPVEPGTFPLAHGVPARVGRLRGYGNAIVPQVAAEVIKAYMYD